MYLSEAKVDQRVWIYCKWSQTSPTSSVLILLAIKGSAYVRIPATVLFLDVDTNLAVLGWKAGEQHPESAVNQPLTIHQVNQGFIISQRYGAHCECEAFEDGVPIPAKKNYGNECPCGVHPSMCEYHR